MEALAQATTQQELAVERQNLQQERSLFETARANQAIVKAQLQEIARSEALIRKEKISEEDARYLRQTNALEEQRLALTQQQLDLEARANQVRAGQARVSQVRANQAISGRVQLNEINIAQLREIEKLKAENKAIRRASSPRR
jgi:hypothetical protein